MNLHFLSVGWLNETKLIVSVPFRSGALESFVRISNPKGEKLVSL